MRVVALICKVYTGTNKTDQDMLQKVFSESFFLSSECLPVEVQLRLQANLPPW